jgi:hypothetical protein
VARRPGRSGAARLRRRERRLHADRRSRHAPRGRVGGDLHGSGHEHVGRVVDRRRQAPRRVRA